MIKISASNINKNPNFIYIPNAFDTRTFDRVYENWSNPEHESWKNFCKEYKVNVIEQLNDVEQYKYTGDNRLVGYIFFKDRNDKRHTQVHFAGHHRAYLPNCLLIIHKEYALTFDKSEHALPEKAMLVVSLNEEFLGTVNKFF